MHEMALTESVVRILEDAATRHDYRRVRRVRLRIGALSHAEPEAIRFCFQAAARGTVAEGAHLDIEHVPAEATCLGCGSQVTIGRRGAPCPHCGGHGLQLTAGDELRVEDVEVE